MRHYTSTRTLTPVRVVNAKFTNTTVTPDKLSAKTEAGRARIEAAKAKVPNGLYYNDIARPDFTSQAKTIGDTGKTAIEFKLRINW